MDKVNEWNTDKLKEKITCILEDSDSNIWVGTEGAGLWRVSRLDNTCIRHKDSAENGINNTDVIKVLTSAARSSPVLNRLTRDLK